MGAGADVNAFFGIMTMLIAVPTGVKIFNWLFTMYRGRIHFASPMYWFLGFILLFTIGGVAGVIMAVPPADFQLHNSLFLVAHFHTMIVAGVVFGFMAGITYWFPKIFGFKLNERLGKYAAACWISGFVLAFGPLYILGLMGATRRMDHYDPSMGWQQLFIVAGFGVGLILLGVGIQILQFIVSIALRENHRDLTGDPWNGRTLEWSTASPAPKYNFAVIPEAYGVDAFWAAKQKKDKPGTKEYEDIYLPKNTPFGMVIAGFAFLVGFGIIWHIWWLALISFVGIIASISIRSTDDQTEYKIPAAEVKKMEAAS
jgi:cytochrome o ubiquinol oxidase subunit 1